MDNDAVNHPAHYNAYEGVEVIQLTGQMNFCRGNAVKYIARAGLKDPSTEIQDLEKAVWYIQYEIELLKRKSAGIKIEYTPLVCKHERWTTSNQDGDWRCEDCGEVKSAYEMTVQWDAHQRKMKEIRVQWAETCKTQPHIWEEFRTTRKCKLCSASGAMPNQTERECETEVGHRFQENPDRYVCTNCTYTLLKGIVR